MSSVRWAASKSPGSRPRTTFYPCRRAAPDHPILCTAKQRDPQALVLLRSIPGVGKVLAMTILSEIHDIHRFDRVQEFASYARRVKCAKESAGKRKGTRGAKMGNVHLKWAFSEAAVLFVRHGAQGKLLLARPEKQHGKGKALSILAHKLGRAAYYLCRSGFVYPLDGGGLIPVGRRVRRRRDG